MYDRAGKSRRKTWLILGAVALVVIAAGAGLGVYFGIVRPNQNKKVSKADSNASSDHSDGNSTSSTGKTPVANLIVSGGDGTKITAEDGTTFTYSNSFGGTWYFDPNNPYANHAQAQSYTPPLNTSWNYGVDKIYGWVHASEFPVFFQLTVSAVSISAAGLTQNPSFPLLSTRNTLPTRCHPSMNGH